MNGVVATSCCVGVVDTDYLTTPTRESMADITITEINLDNTLLLDAINKGKARFVSDCASYLQVRCRAFAKPVAMVQLVLVTLLLSTAGQQPVPF